MKRENESQMKKRNKRKGKEGKKRKEGKEEKRRIRRNAGGRGRGWRRKAEERKGKGERELWREERKKYI